MGTAFDSQASWHGKPFVTRYLALSLAAGVEKSERTEGCDEAKTKLAATAESALGWSENSLMAWLNGGPLRSPPGSKTGAPRACRSAVQTAAPFPPSLHTGSS